MRVNSEIPFCRNFNQNTQVTRGYKFEEEPGEWSTNQLQLYVHLSDSRFEQNYFLINSFRRIIIIGFLRRQAWATELGKTIPATYFPSLEPSSSSSRASSTDSLSCGRLQVVPGTHTARLPSCSVCGGVVQIECVSCLDIQRTQVVFAPHAVCGGSEGAQGAQI